MSAGNEWDEQDHRNPERIVYDVGRLHITHHPLVAKLAVMFRVMPTEWLAPWELEAFDSLPVDVAWRMYRLGVDAGPLPATGPGAQWQTRGNHGQR